MRVSKSEEENSSCNYISNSLTNIDGKTFLKDFQKFLETRTLWDTSKYGARIDTTKLDKIIRNSSKRKIVKNYCLESGLLWKKNELVLSHNETLALNRNQSQKKFQKKQDFSLLYRKQTDENISVGHERKLSPKEVATSNEIKTKSKYQ